jgi:hypothetical protein
LQPHLASGLLRWRGREESEGTSKPSIVETKVASKPSIVETKAHRFGSKAPGVNQSARIPHAGSYQMHRTGSGLQTVGEWGKASWEEESGAVLPFPPGSRLERQRSQSVA